MGIIKSSSVMIDDNVAVEKEKKSVEWIKTVASEIEPYRNGDQESLVFLASRGEDCERETKKMIGHWKAAEQKAIERCAEGRTIITLDTGETRQVGQRSLEEVSNISNMPPHELGDFWSCSHPEDLTIISTMLRTVEWLKIGGFDGWWERLQKTIKESIIHGGGPPDVYGSYWLFNMCRSDYAISLFHSSLVRMLEGLEIPIHGQIYPWRQFVLRDWEEGAEKVDDYVEFAGSLVFTNLRLRRDSYNKGLVDNALKLLLKTQREDGAWEIYPSDDKPSIEATCIALHALALAQPLGWQRACSAGARWLWSVQDAEGYWNEEGCPSDIYLTVLTLDSIELVKGGGRVTFRFNEHLQLLPQIHTTNMPDRGEDKKEGAHLKQRTISSKASALGKLGKKIQDRPKNTIYTKLVKIADEYWKEGGSINHRVYGDFLWDMYQNGHYDCDPNKTRLSRSSLNDRLKPVADKYGKKDLGRPKKKK